MKVSKTLTTLASATFLAGMALVSATATAAMDDKQYRFVGDTQFSSFCKAVVMDDVGVLRTSVSRKVGLIGASEREVLRLITADNGLTCNGSSLIEFSLQRKATSVYEYLSNRS
ncbi:hypothetical protein [Alteromonas sp. CYL-A6]|uniref:hypothetical protein n=1 Tax=Alteromonas nitratireducens TaxID=3390813 RepID=UPI0034BAC979